MLNNTNKVVALEEYICEERRFSRGNINLYLYEEEYYELCRVELLLIDLMIKASILNKKSISKRFLECLEILGSVIDKLKREGNPNVSNSE